MDFFDKLTDIISTTGRDVSNKAKELTEVVKLNSQITAEESKRRETYTLLGKMYFDTIKENPPEDFSEIVSVINSTFETESELRERLRILKGMAKCSGCGRDIPIENAYCSFCGTKNEQPAPEPCYCKEDCECTDEPECECKAEAEANTCDCGCCCEANAAAEEECTCCTDTDCDDKKTEE